MASNWKFESEAERKARLDTEAYNVTQHAATEAPFSGKYDAFYQKGIYVDVVSGEPLFSSTDKYDAGCGWPSFTKPIGSHKLNQHVDHTFGMTRTEVKSPEAGSHLGHVFTDGPMEAGGLRYCINSAAMKFVPYTALEREGYGEYLPLFKDEKGDD